MKNQEPPDQENGTPRRTLELEKDLNLKKVVAIPSATRHVYVSDPTDIRLYADLTRDRNVYVMYEVTDELATDVVQTLHWLDLQNKKPVTIWISNAGGEVFAGLAIFDAIRAMKSPTTTIALGWAASMSSILLQAGDTRLVGRNSFVMCHEVKTIFTEGGTSKLQDEVLLLKRLQERFLDILSERSKMTRKEIEEAWVRKDFWLDSVQAVKLGFVDGVLDDGNTPLRRKKKRGRK